MQQSELGAWLRLSAAHGVGNVHTRRLLATFGSPEAVQDASHAALAQVVGERLAASIRQADADTLLAATLTWLDALPDRQVIAMGDPRYPTALLQTEDPPFLIYVHGQIQALQHPRSVAVVGSRNPTPQGLENAKAFARALSQQGVCVVSGLALGVDGAAHEGALEGGSPTVAVVGTGLDRVYPKRHLELARRIVQQGAMISEYPIGTPPLAPNFPRRNRIIAGLSQGTLVVEAALQSGSLITAEQALQMGREVFAIPGSIHAPQSRGCHALIRQGAKLVESAQDVLEDLRWDAILQPQTQQTEPMLDTSDPCEVMDAMGFEPCSLDRLQDRTGIDTARLQARLLELELDGQVSRLPGGQFQRCVPA